MEEQAREYFIRTKEALRLVLDFVERWNKQDVEKEVAEAARFLSERLLTTSQEK